MQPVDTSRPGFQSLGCGSICTQGFALGWYRSGPLALEAIRRVWILGSVTTSVFSQTDPLPKRELAFGRAEAPVAANGFFIGAAEGIPFPLSSEVCRWLGREQATARARAGEESLYIPTHAMRLHEWGTRSFVVGRG